MRPQERRRFTGRATVNIGGMFGGMGMEAMPDVAAVDTSAFDTSQWANNNTDPSKFTDLSEQPKGGSNPANAGPEKQGSIRDSAPKKPALTNVKPSADTRSALNDATGNPTGVPDKATQPYKTPGFWQRILDPEGSRAADHYNAEYKMMKERGDQEWDLTQRKTKLETQALSERDENKFNAETRRVRENFRNYLARKFPDMSNEELDSQADEYAFQYGDTLQGGFANAESAVRHNRALADKSEIDANIANKNKNLRQQSEASDFNANIAANKSKIRVIPSQTSALITGNKASAAKNVNDEAEATKFGEIGGPNAAAYKSLYTSQNIPQSDQAKFKTTIDDSGKVREDVPNPSYEPRPLSMQEAIRQAMTGIPNPPPGIAGPAGNSRTNNVPMGSHDQMKSGLWVPKRRQ